jgi:hypothetical protein
MSSIYFQNSPEESEPIAEYGTLSLDKENDNNDGTLMAQGMYRASRDSSGVSSGPPSPHWRGSVADLEEEFTPNSALMWLGICGYFALGCAYYASSTQWGWIDSVYFTMQTVTTVGTCLRNCTSFGTNKKDTCSIKIYCVTRGLINGRVYRIGLCYTLTVRNPLFVYLHSTH